MTPTEGRLSLEVAARWEGVAAEFGWRRGVAMVVVVVGVEMVADTTG